MYIPIVPVPQYKSSTFFAFFDLIIFNTSSYKYLVSYLLIWKNELAEIKYFLLSIIDIIELFLVIHLLFIIKTSTISSKISYFFTFPFISIKVSFVILPIFTVIVVISLPASFTNDFKIGISLLISLHSNRQLLISIKSLVFLL